MLRVSDGPQVLSTLSLDRSEYFDRIAELAVRATDFDSAFVSLIDRGVAQVIGSSNFNTAAFDWIKTARDVSPEPQVYFDFDKQFPTSRLVNGIAARSTTAIFVGVHMHGEYVGNVVAISEHRFTHLDDRVVQVMSDLASIAGEIIKTKASLKLMLADVFSLANR